MEENSEPSGVTTRVTVERRILSNHLQWRALLERIQSWIKIPSYNAFRYGMITLYVGTLLMVIGYHNPWMTFSR